MRKQPGFTNSMVDDLDFFIETINPENENEYMHEGKWKPFLLEKEIIPLKSGEHYCRCQNISTWSSNK